MPRTTCEKMIEEKKGQMKMEVGQQADAPQPHVNIPNQNINQVIDDQKPSNQIWPDWLPSDWCIWRDINDDPHASRLYYSCPKGKRFYSKDEIIQYLATYQAKKKMSKKIKRNIINVNKEEKILSAENAPQGIVLSSLSWPDWLPQDWSIYRSYENPNEVWYYNPKWMKFRSKDEVLHYIESKKVSNSKQSGKSLNQRLRVYKQNKRAHRVRNYNKSMHV